MSQLVLIEALASELYGVIEQYGDSVPLASVLGVLEVIKYELMRKAEGEIDECLRNSLE